MTNSTTFLDDAGQPAESTSQVDQPSDVTPEAAKAESTEAQLVGENKKFADTEALAKSKIEADAHIAKIEAENQSFRDQISQMDNNYEAILAKLDQRNQPIVSQEDHDARDDIDEMDLDQVIEAKLTAREKSQLHKANAVESWTALDQVYGDRARSKAAIQELLKEKPYMQSVIENLGKTNPKALVQELINFKTPSNDGNDAIDPLGDISSVTVKDDESAITWKEVNKVRRTDLKKYNSKEFQDLIAKSRQYYEDKGVVYNKTK